MAGETMNKIKSSFNRGITTISLKTSSTIEKSKIKTHIDSLNREIARELAASGEEAYKIWLDGKTDFSELFEKFEGIKGKYKEIEDLTAELSAIDERDNQILGNTPAPQPVQSAPNYVCANCGTQYETAVKFCRKCGNKMAE